MDSSITVYELVKIIHVLTVTLSVAGFSVRVILMLNDSPYQTSFWFKKLPHFNDSVLLLSALTMVYLLGINPFTTPWIAEKLLGLVAYILFGMLALKWGKTKPIKAFAAVFALASITYIILVAHGKTPLLVFQ